MNKKEIKAMLRAEIPYMESVEPAYDEEQGKRTAFLGTVMALDPCGRYHHAISPNGVTSRCERFWRNLESAAEELGGWIESGEGDACDTFFSMPLEEICEECARSNGPNYKGPCEHK